MPPRFVTYEHVKIVIATVTVLLGIVAALWVYYAHVDGKLETLSKSINENSKQLGVLEERVDNVKEDVEGLAGQ